MLGALALTLSRGAWIGCALAILFLLVTLGSARRLLLVFALAVAGVGFVVWSSAPERPELKVVGERARAITDAQPRTTAATRSGPRRPARSENDPFTGQGPGSFPVAAVRAGSPASSVSPDHAHNILLNWGAENGVPAMLIIVGFAIAIGVTIRRASLAARRRGAVARPRDRPLASRRRS